MITFVLLTAVVAAASAGAPALLAAPPTFTASYAPAFAVAPAAPIAVAHAPVAVVAPVPIGRHIHRVSFTPPILSQPIAPPLIIDAPRVVQQVAIAPPPPVRVIAQPAPIFAAPPPVRVVAAPAPVALAPAPAVHALPRFIGQPAVAAHPVSIPHVLARPFIGAPVQQVVASPQFLAPPFGVAGPTAFAAPGFIKK